MRIKIRKPMHVQNIAFDLVNKDGETLAMFFSTGDIDETIELINGKNTINIYHDGEIQQTQIYDTNNK